MHRTPFDRPFDPDGPARGDGLFGLALDPRTAAVQIIPVPWEATASYGRGTRHGPAAILRASQQVDLADVDFGEIWRAGLGLVDLDDRVRRWNDEVEADARTVIDSGGEHPDLAAWVDHHADLMHSIVEAEAQRILHEGNIPAVLGGDHSTPLGLHRAICQTHPGVGFLHIDAHADLRQAYLGFRYSHASIFHNTLQEEGVGKLVGVGWRDLAATELKRIDQDDRIVPFFDAELGRALSQGQSWYSVVERIIDALPAQVHVSLDIDGLDPTLCPNTGTPVPGGLSFRDLQVLLRELSQKRHVVGFDLVEVGAGRWPLAAQQRDSIDVIVGARVLYKLAGCALASRGSA